MGGIQLDLFSWQSEIISECWQEMSRFNFEQAQRIIDELALKLSNDPEINELSETNQHWKNIFLQLAKISNPEKPKYLYSAILKFPFQNQWAFSKLKYSIINEVISLSKRHNIFQLDPITNRADLFLLQSDPLSAEKEIMEYLNEKGTNPALEIQLANIQWGLNKITEAGKNYMWGLMSNSSPIDPRKIENNDLSTILELHGSAQIGPWCWIYGQLNLFNHAVEIFSGYPELNPVSARVCELIKLAEKAKREGQSREMVNFRKALKDLAPEIFSGYIICQNTRTHLSPGGQKL